MENSIRSEILVIGFSMYPEPPSILKKVTLEATSLPKRK